MDEEMKAGKFKAECFQVMERVRKNRQKTIVTQRNVPVAKLAPIEEKAFGKLKDTLHVKRNLINPIEEAWDADS